MIRIQVSLASPGPAPTLAYPPLPVPFRSKHRPPGRVLRYFYLRFIRLRGSPEEIARGLAAGVFAGWFPLFGLQIILGVTLASLVRGNKLIAAAGTWVSNPFTYIPIYLFNFRVGQRLLRSHDWQFSQESLLSLPKILDLGNEFILVLFTGCLVVGLGCALISYLVGLWLIHHLRFQYWRNRMQRQRFTHLKRPTARQPKQFRQLDR